MSPRTLPDLIRQRIVQHGPMGLDEYMALCLGHPEFGYYMMRDPFGAAGDFTTAPEISQMFGEMVGAWLADVWIKMGSPSQFTLLEAGPGRGTLMADIMRSTKRVAGFHAAAHIHLMEMSPVLKAAQAQVLADYDVVWIDGLGQLDPTRPVLIVGNEFLDALPVAQLEHRDGRWWERMVGLGEGDSLCLGLGDVDPAKLALLPPEILNARRDGIFETSREVNQFLKSVNNILLKQGGVALFVDYGHVISDFGETLQAMKSHKYVDIFDTPGSADLTAHVDFGNVARIAREGGMTVHGPVTQGAFLKNLGIEYRAQKLIEGLSGAEQQNASSVCGVNEPQIEAIMSALNRLIDTKQMGSLFKIIALSHDPEIIPAGFHESL